MRVLLKALHPSLPYPPWVIVLFRKNYVDIDDDAGRGNSSMSAGSEGGKVKVVVPVFLARPQDCAKIQVNWHSSWCLTKLLLHLIEGSL